MKTLRLPAIVRDLIEQHAIASYPDECCGIVVERNGVEEVVRVANVQNALHAEDPARYPRTARTAYSMGKEAIPVLLDADRGRLRLLAFYHSHPDHDAYFSDEDRAAALGGWDEPNYPSAGQIVMSVRDGIARGAKAFAWDAAKREFVEIALVVAGG